MNYMGGFMKTIRNLIITIIIMTLISLLSLFIVSVLSYMYKWQADKALIGITITYIVTGFIGGVSQKIIIKEQKSISRKMLDGILTGGIFVGILWIASIFIVQSPLCFSTRFIMIGMLLIGSTCLGRIL